MKISEMITDRYKLRLPPTVYYDLLVDVQEAEEKQEPTTKNDLGVDCISRQAVIDAITANCIWENEYNLTSSRIKKAVENLPSVTLQEPQTFKWCDTCKEYDHEKHCCPRWTKVIRNTVEEMKQEYIEREVLDKIRAKIAEIQLIGYATVDGKREIASRAVLQMIDKYKAETEET